MGAHLSTLPTAALVADVVTELQVAMLGDSQRCKDTFAGIGSEGMMPSAGIEAFVDGVLRSQASRRDLRYARAMLTAHGGAAAGEDGPGAGGGRFSYQDIERGAGECTWYGAAVRYSPQEVQPLVLNLQQDLEAALGSAGGAEDVLVEELMAHSSGLLSYEEAAELVRRVLPSVSQMDIRALFAAVHMAGLDVDGEIPAPKALEFVGIRGEAHPGGGGGREQSVPHPGGSRRGEGKFDDLRMSMDVLQEEMRMFRRRMAPLAGPGGQAAPPGGGLEPVLDLPVLEASTSPAAHPRERARGPAHAAGAGGAAAAAAAVAAAGGAGGDGVPESRLVWDNLETIFEDMDREKHAGGAGRGEGGLKGGPQDPLVRLRRLLHIHKELQPREETAGLMLETEWYRFKLREVEALIAEAPSPPPGHFAQVAGSGLRQDRLDAGTLARQLEWILHSEAPERLSMLGGFRAT